MNSRRRYNLVLAVYPNARGFAFALFEAPLAPVDWGVVEVRGENKNRECIQRISSMFGEYQPEALVLQDMSGREARRARRIRDLNEAIATLAETQGISIFAYSRAQVLKCFEDLGSPTRHRIAEVIAKHVPAFERYLPPVRKIWKSEDSRMGLFDAAALILTFFHTHDERSDRASLAVLLRSLRLPRLDDMSMS
jgi:hypothetical protein